MLSALGAKEDRDRAAASGVVYYYVKTEIDTESIAKKIDEILSQK